MPRADEAALFSGYWLDADTGSMLSRMRWYDPEAGRWITRDAAGYVDGLSLYLYVKSNPLGLWDPTGLRGQEPNWIDKTINAFSKFSNLGSETSDKDDDISQKISDAKPGLTEMVGKGEDAAVALNQGMHKGLDFASLALSPVGLDALPDAVQGGMYYMESQMLSGPKAQEAMNNALTAGASVFIPGVLR